MVKLIVLLDKNVNVICSCQEHGIDKLFFFRVTLVRSIYTWSLHVSSCCLKSGDSRTEFGTGRRGSSLGAEKGVGTNFGGRGMGFLNKEVAIGR